MLKSVFLHMLLGALMICATFAGAQSQTGSIHGTVTDPTGAVIPSSTITVAGPDGQSHSATSGATGAYAVENLAPGDYTVSVSANGFAPSTPRVVIVSSSKIATLDVALALPVE